MQCAHCEAELVSDISVSCPREADAASSDTLFQNACFLSIPYPIRSLVTIIVSILTTLVLFRIDGAVWPLYLLISLFIVGLFAIVLSRARAAGQVAFLIATLTVAWTVWGLQDWLVARDESRAVGIVTQLGRLHDWIEPRAWQVALILWIFCTLWALFVGATFALPAVRFTAIYYLTIVTFTLGLWGTFAVMIVHNAVHERSTRWTLGLACLAPLVFLLVLLISKPPGSDGRADAIAMIGLIATSYLSSVQVFVNVINEGLSSFLPKLLGKSELPPYEFLWLDDVLRWRGLIVGILMAGTFIALLVKSGEDALDRFREIPPPNWFTVGRSGIATTRGFSRLFMPFAVGILATALVIYKILVFVSVTIGYLARNLLRTVVRSLHYVMYIVVPLLLLSGVAILMMLVTRAFRTYRLDESVSPLELWSESVTALVLILVLAVLALAASPGGWTLVRPAIESAMTLGGILYAFVSISAFVVLPLIWWTTRQAEVPLAESKPGTLWVYNTVAIVSLGLAIIAVNFLPLLKRLSMFLTVALVGGVLFVAALRGAPPIVADLRDAFRVPEVIAKED